MTRILWSTIAGLLICGLLIPAISCTKTVYVTSTLNSTPTPTPIRTKILTPTAIIVTPTPVPTPSNCHTVPLWDWGYCSEGCKGNAGEGDCDTDSECSTGYCAKNVGAKYGQSTDMDVCENSISTPIPVMTPTSTTKPIASSEVLNSTELNEKYLMQQYLSLDAVNYLNCRETGGRDIWSDYYGLVGDCTSDGKPDVFLVEFRRYTYQGWDAGTMRPYDIKHNETRYEFYVGTNTGFQLSHYWENFSSTWNYYCLDLCSNVNGFIHYFDNSSKGTVLIEWSGIYTVFNLSTNSLDLFKVPNPSQEIVADVDANGQDELIFQLQRGLEITTYRHWTSPTKFATHEYSGITFVFGFGKDGLVRLPDLEYELLSIIRDITDVATNSSLSSGQKYSAYNDIWERSPRMAGAATLVLGSTQFEDYVGLQLTYMFSGLVRNQLQSAFVNALSGDYAGAAINVGLAFLTERLAANTIRQLQVQGGTAGQDSTGSGSSQGYGSYDVGGMTVDGDLLTDFERKFNVVTEDRVDEIQRQQQERNQ